MKPPTVFGLREQGAMLLAVDRLTEYDPSLKRHRSTCPVCGYAVVRAKREAAEHVMSQHLAYTHEVWS